MMDDNHKLDLSYSMDPEEAFVQAVKDKRSHHHGDPTLKREATTIYNKCSKQERKWIAQRLPTENLEKSQQGGNAEKQGTAF